MLNLVELDPGAVVPEHSHPHEQLGIGLSGVIVMILDGEEHPMGPMDAMHIPSGVVHGAYAGPEGAVVLDVFVPDPRGLPRARRRRRVDSRPTNAIATGGRMPIIHLKIYEERLNDETEPKLIEDFTQVLVDNFGEGIREHTTVDPRRRQAEPVGRRRQGPLAPSNRPSRRKHVYERRRSQRARNARPGRGGRRTRVHRLGLHLHRGPRLDESRRRLAAVLGHARRHAPALDANSGGVEVVAQPSNKGNGLSYDLEGRLLICEHSTSSLIRVEPDGSRTVLASHWQGKELNSPNDVVVASDGSIVFTDPPYGRWPGFGVEREQELDFCGVYRVAPDGEL